MRKQKLERYRALIAEQRDFLDNTVPSRLKTSPSWDFKNDEAYKARAAEIESIAVWLQEDALVDERSRQFDAPPSGAGREPTVSDSGFPTGMTADRQEQASAFYRMLTDGPGARDEAHYSRILKRASLSTASGAVGGYLVPEYIEQSLVQDVVKLQTLRRLGARVMPVIGKQNVPLVNDPTATFVAEATVISSGMSQTDPTVDQIQIVPSLQYATTNYGWHVQTFSPANVEEEIKKSFGRALAKCSSAKFIVGTGSDQPQGLKACATGVEAASTTEFTAAELIQLWNSLDPWHQLSSAFIMSPAAATLARTLESDNGAPLWYANLKDGNNELFGRPVIIDPYMEGLTTSAVPIIVGDVAEAYVIAESPIFFVVDPYSRARHAENVVTAYQFCDGKIRRSTAAKRLIMSDGL